MSCYTPFIPLSLKIEQKNKNSIDQLVCVTCKDALQPQKTDFCPKCGFILSTKNTANTPCIECINTPPVWENFRFLSSYLGEYKDLLIRAKFKGEPNTLKLLGSLISLYCLDIPIPDVVIPMPLHPSRLYARGFNQCQEISRPIAKKLKRPIKNDLLHRIVHTKHQTKLSKQQRLQNIQKAFVASPNVNGLRILLIDDIMTTGTTLRHACKALLESKAKAVDVCVIARTQKMSTLATIV